ncbi:MAG: PLP-dependent aminotransferase family protein [Thermodesulfobacteriota bacterium]
MDKSSESHKELMTQFWQRDQYLQLVNPIARKRAGSLNLWAGPEQVEPRKELIYLSIGIPDSDWLPRGEWNKAMQKVMNRTDDSSLRYGFGKGYYPIRKYLAEKYTREKGVEVDEEWFLLTNGSTVAIDLIVRSIIEPGDVIVTETPTYMGSLSNFLGVGAEICPIPMDESGLEVQELERKIRQLKDKGRRVKLVYIIPAFHNPSGITMSAERKKDLLQLANQEKFLIMDDDAYGDLYYDAPPSVSLMGLSGGGGVITTGTFSKTLATGLRIGWVAAHPDLINIFLRMKFDMGQNQMALQALGRFLEGGHLEPHVEIMRELYHKKMTLVADLMERHLSDFVEFERPGGGFYLWLKLKNGLTSHALWRTATQEGVSVNPGYASIPNNNRETGEYIRIAYSWTPIQQLEEAVLRLASACQRVAHGDSA